MKKMLLPIGALGLIFLLSLCNGAAVTRKTLRWQQQILRAQASALQGRWSDAAALLEESHQDWERAQLYLHIVLEHDAIDDAEAMYRRRSPQNSGRKRRTWTRSWSFCPKWRR